LWGILRPKITVLFLQSFFFILSGCSELSILALNMQKTTLAEVFELSIFSFEQKISVRLAELIRGNAKHWAERAKRTKGRRFLLSVPKITRIS